MVVRAAVLVFVSMVVGGIFKLLHTTFGSRGMGVDEFAAILIVISIFTLIKSIAMIGCQIGIVRYIQYFEEEKKYGHIEVMLFWTLIIVISVCCILLIVFTLFVETISLKFSNPNILVVFNSLVFGVPFLVVSELLSFYYRAIGHHTIEVLIRVVIPPFILLFSIVISIIAREWTYGLLFILLSWILLGSSTFFLVIKRLKKNLQYLLSNFPTEYFKYSIPLSIMPVVNRLNVEFYILAVGLFSSSEELIAFAVAMRVASQVSLISKSINVPMQRVIAKSFAKNNLLIVQKYYQNSSRYCLLLTFPIVIVIIMISPELFQFIRTPFMSSFVLIVCVLIGNLVHVSLGVNGMIIRMGGWSILDLKITIVELIFTLLIGFLLVSSYGVVGAGVAYLIVRVLINALKTFFAYINTGLLPFSRKYYRASLYAIVLMLVAISSAFIVIGFVNRVIFLLLFFFVSIYFYRFWCLDNSEIKKIENIIKRYIRL